jgi:hypothetical protein
MFDSHIIIFNEVVKGRFSGFKRADLLSDLPLWGNFFVEDIFNASGVAQHPHSLITAAGTEDLEKMLEVLQRSDTGGNIIVGRMGNLTVLDWSSLVSKLKPAGGAIKVQVGKIPSDLYCVKKKYLISVVKEFIVNSEKSTAETGFGSFPQFLFNEALFYNFERIVDVPGLSFFLRDPYEYYRENLMIVKYIGQTNFNRLYLRLHVKSSSNTIVGQDAVIKNSLLGNGSSVLGRVEDSVIFSDVTVGSNSLVKNSVILPSNVIEEGVEIENALVLGGDGRVIEKDSKIGRDGSFENIHEPGLAPVSEAPGSDMSRDRLVIVTEGVRISEGSRLMPGDFVRDEVDTVLSRIT